MWTDHSDSKPESEANQIKELEVVEKKIDTISSDRPKSRISSRLYDEPQSIISQSDEKSNFGINLA